MDRLEVSGLQPRGVDIKCKLGRSRTELVRARPRQSQRAREFVKEFDKPLLSSLRGRRRPASEVATTGRDKDLSRGFANDDAVAPHAIAQFGPHALTLARGKDTQRREYIRTAETSAESMRHW